MKLECPKCLTEALLSWWLSYDGEASKDKNFEEVETAIEYLETVMTDHVFPPADLCEIHKEDQNEMLLQEQEHGTSEKEPEPQNQTQS